MPIEKSYDSVNNWMVLSKIQFILWCIIRSERKESLIYVSIDRQMSTLQPLKNYVFKVRVMLSKIQTFSH